MTPNLTHKTLMDLPHTAGDIDEGVTITNLWAGIRTHADAWKDQVNTLTNERDLAIRANEQNINIIKSLRRKLRKQRL